MTFIEYGSTRKRRIGRGKFTGEVISRKQLSDRGGNWKYHRINDRSGWDLMSNNMRRLFSSPGVRFRIYNGDAAAGGVGIQALFGYVTEDGTKYYVGEDGATLYIQE